MNGLTKRNLRSDLRLITSPFRVLPDFIIPGEAKCGTTSIYRYMCQNPDIYPADVKEPNNFIHHPQSAMFCKCHYPLIFTRIFHENVRRGKFLTGEASAEYLSKHKTPAAIAGILPDVKIVILMRNPVTRAYSDYQMLKKYGVISEEFDEIAEKTMAWIADSDMDELVESSLQVEHSVIRYVYRGIYVNSVKRWLDNFPRENIMFIKSEEFFENPQNILDDVYGFLGARGMKHPEFQVKKMGEYDTAISPDLAAKMAGFYKPYNEKLYELTGRDFGWEAGTKEMIRTADGRQESGLPETRA